MLKQLLLQLILILINAFFAATEIAVISLNEKKVKARAENGDKKAGKMLKMIEDPTQFLSTIQVGITLAGFLGSAFAADNFAERLTGFIVKTFSVSASQISLIETVSVVVITLILSYFTLVLGELVPKRLAQQHKEKLAEIVCSLISGLSTVLKPIIWFLTVSTNGVLRLFGVDPHAKEEPVSEEDIMLMLDAGADEGSLDENDIEYIKNVFKLDRLTAEDIMIPRKTVICVYANAGDASILSVIEDEGYSRIPVLDPANDRIIGILHSRDYLLGRGKPGFTLHDALHPAVYVPESVHLDSLFKEMQKAHNHMVVVVNEYGETSGIVSIEDILEELVGEIWDESDEAIEEIIKLTDSDYRILCSTSLESFFEYFELEPDEETEAVTVNGWLTETIGRIPEKGYRFTYRDYTITITKADDLMVHEIQITVNPA